MEHIYLLLVVILFILAISDLIVGVSNDAVNFLNSAIGSKAASFKVVIFVAALGVLVGSVFSGGMMEIARSGIFHPDKFSFADIMLIFLAVMITDVILLDTFNALGLPTSTTVSIVFELLGASVAIAWMKISNSVEPMNVGEFINSSKALAIISGILLSVVIAFSFGAFIQFLTRLLFTFNYHKRLRYLGGVYGGVALTIIIYFMLIKGAKDAAFMTPEILEWINKHTVLILISSLLGFTIILQLLNWLFRLNILKTIVIVGTFSLAMAFAGNDLVNFIGVPLAGYESYKTFIATTGIQPDNLMMGSLKNTIQTPIIFLVLSGVVMVFTLYTSRKARLVIKTEVNLSRQNVGHERFGSTQLSRSVVRLAVNISDTLSNIVPNRLKKIVSKQFVAPQTLKSEPDPPAFDLVRASVNLVVASGLIAMGTSLKLPLSTTYVTFMVAMGSSLSDGAWDRESAVYRVTGVFSVIGGWFFTAIMAFSLSFTLAILFYYGELYAIGLMLIVAVYLIFRTHKAFLKKEVKTKESEQELDDFDPENILEACSSSITEIINQTQLEYKNTINALSEEKIKNLKKSKKTVEALALKAKEKKNTVTTVIHKLQDDAIESGHFYVQALDYLREIIHSLNYIVVPVFNHVDNNHKPLSNAQISELKILSTQLGNFFAHISRDITENNFSNQEFVSSDQQKILSVIDLFRKNEVKRIKKDATSTRNSLLFMTVLQETKNMLLFAFNLYKAQRDFLNYHESRTDNH